MLATIGCIILGIAIIVGLFKDGEIGCLGPVLIVLLVFLLLGIFVVFALTHMGGVMY